MRIERFSFIFFVAGIGMFLFSFVTLVASPWWLLKDIPTDSVEKMAGTEISDYFPNMAKRYPEEFKRYFGEVNAQSYAEALRLGRDVYVSEACWHCHSQFVRPVSNESKRYGRVSTPEEYQNELQLPQLFGTRRVGPDLSRVGGKYENVWHFDHFKNPSSHVHGSVMPVYSWFFDAEGKPNKKGMAIVTYLQWLGTWPIPKGVEEEWGE